MLDAAAHFERLRKCAWLPVRAAWPRCERKQAASAPALDARGRHRQQLLEEGSVSAVPGASHGMAFDRAGFSPRLLAEAAVKARDLLRAAELFKRLIELATGKGGPFSRLHYDFDSLDNRDARAVERVLRLIAEPMQRYFEADVIGLEHVIEGGGQLFVGNHNGGACAPEIFLFGAAVYRRFGLDALPYGLAHQLVGLFPPFARALIPLGAVRASPGNAARIFARSRNVLVYPGGDEESMRPSSQRDQIVFAGRTGYVRLALRHGVPIVPVVTFGAHDVFVVLDDGRWIAERLGLDRLVRLKVMPTVLCLPWGITLGPLLPFIPLPARVRLEVLPPLRFERQGEAAARDADYVAACDAQVRSLMQASLTRMAAELRGPKLAADLVPQPAPANDQHSRRRAA
jgi:1-acyl-sn-glycerol-3-phosphate acyltransferase